MELPIKGTEYELTYESKLDINTDTTNFLFSTVM